MEGPKRLFLDAHSSVYRVASKRLKDDNIEYIRADIHARLLEAAREASEFLWSCCNGLQPTREEYTTLVQKLNKAIGCTEFEDALKRAVEE